MRSSRVLKKLEQSSTVDWKYGVWLKDEEERRSFLEVNHELMQMKEAMDVRLFVDQEMTDLNRPVVHLNSADQPQNDDV